MRAFRLLFDLAAFYVPIYSPKHFLALYAFIHVYFPRIVTLPRRLDTINHILNFHIPLT